jgi:putative intracellular protease/amidase/DNA-directed RNA polymerase subunit RPC12/RpoP
MKILILAILSAALCASSATIGLAEIPKVYVCPDCGCPADNRTFDKPGACPECGMPLIEKSANKKQDKLTVAILLFDGAEIIDYAGPWEAFGEAGFQIFTVAEKAKPIHAVYGQTITADYTFANSPAADVLLVPGGAVENAMANATLLKWVQKNAQTSKHVMSVCTGAFILAKAGLLDGLTATTVSHAIDGLGKISSRIKVVRDQRYVDNGKVITTAGLSSGIDGAFHVIEKIKGRGEAQATALGMEYRWDPDSKFARAALADTHFPEFNGVDAQALSTQGDAEHWEAKVLVSQPASASAILELLGKKIVAGTPRTRGPVILTPASSSEIEWKFTDEQGSNWNGRGTVEPAEGQTGKFIVTLRLAREPKST